MNHEDAERWRQALSAYRYPVARDRIVRFAKRIDAAAPWFNFDLSSGTRGETIDFEQRFRSFGPKAIEPWFEVIFWKLASMSGRGESKAAEMIEGLSAINAQAPKLWSACANFVGAGSQKSFETLQDELFIVTKSIPVAATFFGVHVPRAVSHGRQLDSEMGCRLPRGVFRRRRSQRLGRTFRVLSGAQENDAHPARRLAILRRLDPILPNGGQHSYAANRISVARSRYRNGCVPERTFRIAPASSRRMTGAAQTPVQRLCRLTAASDIVRK